MSNKPSVLKEGKFNRLWESRRIRGRTGRVAYKDAAIRVTEQEVSFEGKPIRTETPLETVIDFRGILRLVLETYEGRDGKPLYMILVNRFVFWTGDKTWFNVIDEKVRTLGNLRRREVIEYRPTRYTIPRIIQSTRSP